MAGKPAELARAELIVGLCDRFHCLPSQLLEEDWELLRMLELVELGRPDDEGDDGDGEGPAVAFV